MQGGNLMQGSNPLFARSNPSTLEQRKAQLIQRLAQGQGSQGGAQPSAPNPLIGQIHLSPTIFGMPQGGMQSTANTPPNPMATGSTPSNPYHSMPIQHIGTALGSFMGNGMSGGGY